MVASWWGVLGGCVPAFYVSVLAHVGTERGGKGRSREKLAGIGLRTEGGLDHPRQQGGGRGGWVRGQWDPHQDCECGM